jgi:CelD/BcsL family acetyltransferase involved in cellulose biosynthesis
MPRSCELGSFAAGLPLEWQELVAQSAPTFDQTLPWFIAFERHLLRPGERLHLLGVADDAGTPLALLPLRRDLVPLAGRVRAAGLVALSNYYTALFAPLGTPAGTERAVPALARAAVAAGAGAAVIDLNPVAADDAASGALAAEWEQQGYRIERYFRFGNWYLEVGGRSSEAYLASLPGQLRSTLQRKGKKLYARPDVSVRIVTEPTEVPAALDAYEAVYRSSWKSDEPGREFIRAVAAEFARRDWLRLGLIALGTRPVAAQIWFVYRGTASIFKLAYDEEFAQLSVGSALTLALMRHALDVDRVAVVDYLCGDDAYKRDWMSARRERLGIRAIRRASWPGALTALMAVARRIRRSGAPLPRVPDGARGAT